jgi:hypothetical protein
MTHSLFYLITYSQPSRLERNCALWLLTVQYTVLYSYSLVLFLVRAVQGYNVLQWQCLDFILSNIKPLPKFLEFTLDYLFLTSRSAQYNASANYHNHNPRLPATKCLVPNTNYMNNVIFKPVID